MSDLLSDLIGATFALALIFGATFWYIDSRIPEPYYVCYADDVVLTVTDKQARSDAGLIFGTLPDGRQVAINRARIKGCARAENE